MQVAAAVSGATDTIAGAAQGIASFVGNAALALFADGGYTQAPTVYQGFAAGTQTIPKRTTSIMAGGIKTQELLTRVREGHQNEAVVPLPGNGRSIPVDLREPAAMSRRGGETIVNQEAHLHLNVVSDDRSFTQKVAAQMPMIEKMLTATLSQGGNRALEQAVGRAGN
jgi:hypothetical protein